jgi:hypothetical protein
VIVNGGEVAALAPQIDRLHALYLAFSKKAQQTCATFVILLGLLQNHENSASPPIDVILIVYEYPFNERIRTLLRLEDLYEKFKFLCIKNIPCSITWRWRRSSTCWKWPAAPI